MLQEPLLVFVQRKAPSYFSPAGSWVAGGEAAPGPRQVGPCQWHRLAGSAQWWKRWAASLQLGAKLHLAAATAPSPHALLGFPKRDGPGLHQVEYVSCNGIVKLWLFLPWDRKEFPTYCISSLVVSWWKFERYMDPPEPVGVYPLVILLFEKKRLLENTYTWNQL